MTDLLVTTKKYRKNPEKKKRNGWHPRMGDGGWGMEDGGWRSKKERKVERDHDVCRAEKNLWPREWRCVGFTFTESQDDAGLGWNAVRLRGEP